MEDVQKSLDDLESKLLNEHQFPKKLKFTIAILITIFAFSFMILIIKYFYNFSSGRIYCYFNIFYY